MSLDRATVEEFIALMDDGVGPIVATGWLKALAEDWLRQDAALRAIASDTTWERLGPTAVRHLARAALAAQAEEEKP